MSSRFLASVLATAFGLVMVIWGWILQGAEYLPNLLLQVGSSLMLAVPLLALGRTTERRVRRTEQHLADVRDRLDNLDEITSERLVDRHRQRELLLRAAEAEPTSERLQVLLREASFIGAVDPNGVRVRLPETARWLRFAEADRLVRITEERRDGTPGDTVRWRGDDSVKAIATALRLRSREVESAARELVRTLRMALSARTGDSGLRLGPVIEVSNKQWAISTDGLHCVQRLCTSKPTNWSARTRTGAGTSWRSRGSTETCSLRHTEPPRNSSRRVSGEPAPSHRNGPIPPQLPVLVGNVPSPDVRSVSRRHMGHRTGY
ncbi:hypothetical protein EV192_10511 [Actinocrispum wychmicini]|uniref:Uncharacterized protein n=1 Tax=Actinocrispum wychmicini TaxID=1213861 RepID=A0A4R2JMS5_9PSEU|nr:hypothetical protein EV192_10511 [Actinocrispum wychmicini]